MADTADILKVLGVPGPQTSSDQAQNVQQAVSPAAPQATTAGPDAPTMTFATGTPPRPKDVNTSGPELLPQVDYAVKQIESGNSQVGKDGKVLVSPKGAIGISQLMPDTAKKHGVDPYNPEQNAQGGRDELKDLYQHYGNWTDAVAAYNAGEGRVNKWIAAGRPDSGDDSLPSETKKYVPAVMAQIGMSPGVSFVAAKDGGSPQDILDALNEQHVAGGGTGKLGPKGGAEGDQDDDNLAFSLLGMNQNPVDISEEGQSETLAAVGGAFAGLRDIPAGVVQAGLEKFAPAEWSQGFTNFINNHMSPFQHQMDEHPFAQFAGNVVGTTVGLMGAARLIGPAVGPVMETSVGSLLRSLPTALKATGAGTALGATSFNKDPDQASRLGEAVTGGILGFGGSMIARQVAQGFRAAGQLVDRAQMQQWLQQLQKNVSDLEPSTSALKDTFANFYETMTQARNRRYTVRDKAGNVLQGYPTGLEQGGGIQQVVKDAMEGNIGRDQSSANTKVVGRKLDEVLGLDEQRRAQDQAAKDQIEYDKAIEVWNRKYNRGGKLPASYLDRLAEMGKVPERPTPPVPFESTPISPEQMAEARRVIEGAAQRIAKSDIKTRSQLRILKKQFDTEASSTARTAGVSVSEYERLQKEADNFNKTVIAPMQRIAGRRTVQEFRDQSTKAEMYDQVVGMMKGHDREKQEVFAKMLGARGRQQAKMAMLNDMMDQAITDSGGTARAGRISKYLEDHRSGMQTVLGRDEYEQMVGTAKIAQKLLEDAKSKPGKWTEFFGEHRWMKSWGLFKIAEGAVTMNPHTAMEGVGYIGTAYGLQLFKSAVSGIAQNPRLAGVIARAGKASGPELDRLIKSVDAAMSSSARVLSRVVPQESGGADVGSAVETGASAVGGVGEALTYSWGH